jgi:hypothetical protein
MRSGTLLGMFWRAVVGADGCRSRVCAHARPHRKCVRSTRLLSGASLRLFMVSEVTGHEPVRPRILSDSQAARPQVQSALRQVKHAFAALPPTSPTGRRRAGHTSSAGATTCCVVVTWWPLCCSPCDCYSLKHYIRREHVAALLPFALQREQRYFGAFAALPPTSPADRILHGGRAFLDLASVYVRYYVE